MYEMEAKPHVVPVTSSVIRQWLQGMNIPSGKPVLLQFEYNEPASEGENPAGPRFL
jgi:hypothetical protein